jgi:hypothetical protein
MATQNVKSKYTLYDLIARTDPTGNAAYIAEVLTQVNPMIEQAPFVEANDGMGYKFSQRSKLPTGNWRDFNMGVGTEKTDIKTITEHCGMLGTYSKIDAALLRNMPSPETHRTIEARAYIEGLGQTAAKAIFYGGLDAKNIEFEPRGFAARLNKLNLPNVFDMGGNGNNLSSLYIVQWSEVNGAFLFHPKSHPTKGIEHEDRGIVDVKDDEGKEYPAYVDYFTFAFGIGVRNQKAIARVANIKWDAEIGQPGAFNEDVLIRAVNKLLKGVQTAIYTTSEVTTQMQIRMKDKNNIYYTPGGGNGLYAEPVVHFNNIPIYNVDSVSLTEAKVN